MKQRVPFWIAVVVLLILGFGCSSDEPDGPASTATGTKHTLAMITGQILLEPIEGLGDMSRVQIDAGKAGTVSPAMDGSFVLKKVPAGAYDLTITYAGGLTDAAGDSAYQRVVVNVTTLAGNVVNVGRIALPLGVGTVRGKVEYAESAGATARSTIALRNERTTRQVDSPDGNFEFSDVPVGNYALVVERSGFAQPSCSATVTVPAHGAVVSSSAIKLEPTSVTLLPGLNQTLNTDGSTWYLATDSVTVNVQAGFAVEGKAWLDGATVPAYTAVQSGGYSFGPGLPSGATIAHFRFRDTCGFESADTSLKLVRDTTTPVIDLCELQGGAEWIQTSTAALTLSAHDDLSPTLEMQLILCNQTSTGDTCQATPEAAPWVAYANSQSVTFDASLGTKKVRVRVRDRSGNVSEFVERTVVLDNQSPSGIAISLAGATGGKICTRTPVVHIAWPSDAVQRDTTAMKLGLVSGLADSAWLPFVADTPIQLPAGDGPKTVFARFRDAAGNESQEISTSVVLDSMGTVSGAVAIEDGASPAIVEVVALGTSYRTSVASDGNWTITLPAANYNLQWQVTGTDPAVNQRYSPVGQAVAVHACQSTSLALQVLDVARGSVAGTLALEGGASPLGILVQLQDSVGSIVNATTTDSTGRYTLFEVPMGTYKLVFSRAGFLPLEEPGCAVSVGATTPIPARTLTALRGSLKGKFLLSGQSDHAQIAVKLAGTEISATTAADGTFTLSGVPAGSYDLEATRSLYLDYRLFSVSVRGNEVTDIGTHFLDLGGRIVGMVTLEAQTSYAGATVRIPGTAYQTTTDASGQFTLAVAPLNYNQGLIIEKSHFETKTYASSIPVLAQSTFDVGPLALKQLENDMTGSATLYGLTDYSGIQVDAYGETDSPTEGLHYQAITDASGSFRLSNVQIGHYRVNYRYLASGGWESPQTAGVLVAPGPEIKLEPRVLRTRYLTIASGAPSTRSRDVKLTLGASDCYQMLISESASFAGATWVDCATSPDYHISSAGDGTKTIYAKFHPASAPTQETEVVSASIVLDTTAGATAFLHNGGTRVLKAGDSVHLTLTANEIGHATFTIANYETALELFDDGSHGDVTAGDHKFERDWAVTQTKDIDNAVVTGLFVDAIGNSTSINAPDRLTIHVAPNITNVSVKLDNQASSATISWATDETATGVVEYGTTAAYGTTSSVTASGVNHSVTLSGLSPADTYHYRIVATDANSNAANTTDATFRLRPNTPTFVAAIPGKGRVWIRWEAPTTEPLGYDVYRATAAGGTYTKLNTTSVTEEPWMYRDDTVTNGQAYYYVVRAISGTTESDASAEVSATPQSTGNGGTTVQGAIDRDTVWSELGSPYTMTGGISIEANKLLTIGPNVRVQVDGFYRFVVSGRIASLGERGKLATDGTESDEGMVVITSNKPTPVAGDWRGIYFETSSPAAALDLEDGHYFGGNLFYRTKLQYAGDSALVNQVGDIAVIRSIVEKSIDSVGVDRDVPRGGALQMNGGTALVADSILRENGANTGAAIFLETLYGVPTEMTVVRSTISSNTQRSSSPGYCSAAVSAEPGWIAGPGAVGASVTLRLIGTKITKNQATSGAGAALCFCPDYNGKIAQVIVADSEISGNTGPYGPAVWTQAAQATRVAIVNTTFTGNTTSRSDLSGIYPAAFNLRNEATAKNHVIAGSRFVTDAVAGTSLDAGGWDEYYANVFDHRQGELGWGLRCLWVWGGSCAGQAVVDVQESNHFFVGSQTGSMVWATRETVMARNSFFAASGSAATMVGTLEAYTAPNVNAQNNYWGTAATVDLQAGGNPKNISSIWDYYDNIERARVDYANWATTAFPMPRISAPRWGHRYKLGTAITFTGAAQDPEDGALGDNRLEWRDNAGNVVGNGASISLSTLALGIQRLWLYAYDSNGQMARVPVEVAVVQ